ncbi:helix-turn-helix transcriptional regulator [Nocardia sp. BMG51109]|uniref:helix-turn-helix domain-containing protein n=1 Tax=Nocardia sp. BMG51109 TaxID=1056816 RepID=UPI0018DDBBB1|nr:helix-turn-helix transcriptional regulator [Nocardia sp. BMG51109]
MSRGPTGDPTTEPEPLDRAKRCAAVANELAREIKRFRNQAGMSQRVLASKIGYSRQYVTMTEWEDANLPSYELVAAIDSALSAEGALISLRAQAKISQPSTALAVTRTSTPADDSSIRQRSPAIMELCAVLTDYGFNPDRFGSSQSGQIPSVECLERDLEVTFVAYQQSRFAAAAGRVAMLLADIQLVLRQCKESERDRLYRVLALAYQAAASVLIKAGEVDLAWIASERGLSASDSASNSAIRGSLIRSVAFSLLSTGRFESAMNLVESGTELLKTEISGNDSALSVYGTLLLVGSMAAARFGDEARTVGYLDEANDAAHRLTRDANHLWTAFGLTNVAIHRANTAAELGDIKTVLGSTVDLSSVPVERRVRYLLDVARAHSLAGNRDDALSTMLAAERMAPEQVHQHYLSRKVVATLVRSTVSRQVEIDRLARRVNAVESI